MIHVTEMCYLRLKMTPLSIYKCQADLTCGAREIKKACTSLLPLARPYPLFSSHSPLSPAQWRLPAPAPLPLPCLLFAPPLQRSVSARLTLGDGQIWCHPVLTHGWGWLDPVPPLPIGIALSLLTSTSALPLLSAPSHQHSGQPDSAPPHLSAPPHWCRHSSPPLLTSARRLLDSTPPPLRHCMACRKASPRRWVQYHGVLADFNFFFWFGHLVILSSIHAKNLWFNLFDFAADGCGMDEWWYVDVGWGPVQYIGLNQADALNRFFFIVVISIVSVPKLTLSKVSHVVSVVVFIHMVRYFINYL